MAINKLPKLMLTKIFKYLPLEEQLDNCFVCKLWNRVQQNIFDTQESLTILEDVIAVHRVIDSPFGAPFIAGNQKDDEFGRVKDRALSSYANLLASQYRKWLHKRLPQVRHLTIAMNHVSDEVLEAIAQLLRGKWRTKLDTFELFVGPILVYPNVNNPELLLEVSKGCFVTMLLRDG